MVIPQTQDNQEPPKVDPTPGTESTFPGKAGHWEGWRHMGSEQPADYHQLSEGQEEEENELLQSLPDLSCRLTENFEDKDGGEGR